MPKKISQKRKKNDYMNIEIMDLKEPEKELLYKDKVMKEKALRQTAGRGKKNRKRVEDRQSMEDYARMLHKQEDS